MKKLLIALMGPALLMPKLSAQTLLWSDEFNASQLDRSVWTFDVGSDGFGNGELQTYTDSPDNVKVENGNLVITARRNGNDFTSARLKTYGKFDFQYGRVEARIKLPDVANGLWPAFWAMGNNFGTAGWPYCGEMDIMEVGMKSAIDANNVNRTTLAALHWWHETGTWDPDWLHATHSTETTLDSAFYNRYHVWGMNWTPTTIEMYIDDPSNPHFTMNITDPEFTEFRDNPAFLLLNLAVGGNNFVQITDPAQITAPFPAEMLVDWIRIYDNGHATVNTGSNDPKTGKFGVFTETTQVNDQVTFGTDAELYIWNNMVAATPSGAFEGSDSWAFNATPGQWCGMGVATTGPDLNMENYADGNLKLHMKTTSTADFTIGVESGGAGGGSVQLVAGNNEFGMQRDGQWHEVTIPLNLMGNVDFRTIVQSFTFVCANPDTNKIEFDNIYWEPSGPTPKPTESFGIFTETTPTNDVFTLGVDGEFYVWENTLTAAPENPYEGSGSLSFTSATGMTWFGAAFTPSVKYDLSAFHNDTAMLHVALKTSSNATFQIGMKSGNIDGIGQQWITFESGNDPYGFARDGNWHSVEIPMSDFYGRVDLGRVSQLFEILGTDGPITDLEIDDIYIHGGSSISLQETSVQENIQLYPNPAKEGFYLKGNSKAGKVEIYNISGQLVKTGELSRETATYFDMSQLPDGIYIIRIETDELPRSLKFVKE